MAWSYRHGNEIGRSMVDRKGRGGAGGGRSSRNITAGQRQQKSAARCTRREKVNTLARANYTEDGAWKR